METPRSFLLEEIPGIGQAVATCRICGCTDLQACPGGCSWAKVDRAKQTGVCSNCVGRRRKKGRKPTGIAHRKGPWKITSRSGGCCRIGRNETQTIAVVGGNGHDQALADASRIVQCVNLCEGLTEPEIRRMVKAFKKSLN